MVEEENKLLKVHTFKSEDAPIDKLVEITQKSKSESIRNLIYEFISDPRHMSYDLSEDLAIDDMMTVSEVAAQFDVNDATVLRWITRDGLGKIKRGGVYLIHPTHIINHFNINSKLKNVLRMQDLQEFLQNYMTPKKVEKEFGIPRYKTSRLKKKKRIRTFPIGKNRYLVHIDSIKYYLKDTNDTKVEDGKN